MTVQYSPPSAKMMRGSDVRVTTAAVYWRETEGVEEGRTKRKTDPETQGRENI